MPTAFAYSVDSDLAPRYSDLTDDQIDAQVSADLAENRNIRVERRSRGFYS